MARVIVDAVAEEDVAARRAAARRAIPVRWLDAMVVMVIDGEG